MRFTPFLLRVAVLSLAAPSLAACGPSSQDRQRAGGPEDAPGAWVELVLADRDFSEAAASEGTQAAFLSFMAESGILFRPAPVAAIPILEEGPALPGELTWSPEDAHVSRDGATGVTSGPFRLTPTGAGQVQTGRYVTLWRRRSEGSFAAELTVRVPGPVADLRPAQVRPLGPLYRWAAEGMPDESGLLALDETFRARYGSGDVDGMAALAPHPDVLVLRAGRAPEEGLEALQAGARRSRELRGLTWQAQGARFADDGSLGYVYGLVAPPPPTGSGLTSGAAAPFLHVWIRDEEGSWRVLVDLLGVPGA